MPSAFVSHSTPDDRYVAEMESFLRAAGFDPVFNDVRSIEPDEKFWPAIQKGIEGADTFVVVITSASNDSDWVKREIDYARSLSKKIIPLWIEDCPIPEPFTDRDVIDLRPRTRAFLKPLADKLTSFRFWLKFVTIGALIFTGLACWQFFVAKDLQEKVNELTPQVKQLEEDKTKLSLTNQELTKGKDQLIEDNKVAQGNLIDTKRLTAEAEDLRKETDKELQSVKGKLDQKTEELESATEELKDIKSRLVCVMDSTNRRSMMGRICGELNRLPDGRAVIIDQEPVIVGKKTSEFKAQINEAAATLATQIKSISQRHPALVIVHLHALRPEKQNSESDPNVDLQASELLAALVHFKGTPEFPAPDILVYSRVKITKKGLLALATDPVKDAVNNMEPRIHTINAPLKASTSDDTALGLEVSRILNERKQRH